MRRRGSEGGGSGVGRRGSEGGGSWVRRRGSEGGGSGVGRRGKGERRVEDKEPNKDK